MDEHPFRLLYGREPRLPMDAALLPPSSLNVKDSAHRSVLVKNIELAQKLALEFYNNSQEKMKRNYDKNAAPSTFKVGDRVLLHDTTRKKGQAKKLQHQYTGPYMVIEKKGPVTFSGFRGRDLGSQRSSMQID